MCTKINSTNFVKYVTNKLNITIKLSENSNQQSMFEIKCTKC